MTLCADLHFEVWKYSYLYINLLAILQKWVPYSQRYLVLGLVGLVGLGLPLL